METLACQCDDQLWGPTSTRRIGGVGHARFLLLEGGYFGAPHRSLPRGRCALPNLVGAMAHTRFAQFLGFVYNF